MVKLVISVLNGEWNGNRSKSEAGENQQGQFDHVGELDRYRCPGPDVSGGKSACHGIDFGVHLRPGQAAWLTAEDVGTVWRVGQCWVVGSCGNGSPDEVVDGLWLGHCEIPLGLSMPEIPAARAARCPTASQRSARGLLSP